MNTNLELVKGTEGAKNCFYMSDAGSKLINYADLDAGNKAIFDTLVTDLKAEFSNDQLAKAITGTESVYNQNLDVLFNVDDVDLTGDVNVDAVAFSSLSAGLQASFTAFVNMANAL